MNLATKKSQWLNKAAVTQHLKNSLAAFVFVSLATALRVWPLQALGSELAWLTFYPAVIAAALYAGFYTGLLATVLACLTVIFLWPLFVMHTFIENRFDLLEMAIFLLTSSFIAYLVEAVQRMRKRLKETESILKRNIEREQFIHSIVDNVPNMIGYWDRDLHCRYANNAYREWFGKSPEEIVGMTFRDLAGEHLFALNQPHIHRVLAGEHQRFERTLNKASGNVGHIIGHYIPDFDVDGTVKGFAIQSSEVTLLKETEAKLELAACVFKNTLEGVLITDTDGTILSVNPAFSEITGYAAEEAIGQNPRILKSNQYDRAFYTSIWVQITTMGRWNGEIWNRRKNGALYLERVSISMVRDVDGEPIRYVSVFSDITAFWSKGEHIKHLAFHDALTDLPNRTLLMDRIDQRLINSNREPCDLALMFIDLDGFKLVNDQYGHNIGDDLLKEVAKRLLSLVRESDTVARVGGDEFIVVLNNPREKEEVAYIANCVVSSINEPMEILAQVLHVGASVGIAMYPDDASTSVDLIKNADTAMYIAKESGRNKIHFFSHE